MESLLESRYLLRLEASWSLLGLILLLILLSERGGVIGWSEAALPHYRGGAFSGGYLGKAVIFVFSFN